MTRPSTPGAPRLLLVRHGEVEEWARGRIYGRLDPSLSPAGREQAAGAASRLVPERPVALYTSPSARALETAGPIGAACALEPLADIRLREIEFGEFEGLTFAEAQQRDHATWREWMEQPGRVRFPGGECWDDVRARSLESAESIAAAHPAAASVVVTHGGVVRALIAEALGLPADRTFRIEIAFGSLTVLRREPFGWMVEAMNVRG